MRYGCPECQRLLDWLRHLRNGAEIERGRCMMCDSMALQIDRVLDEAKALSTPTPESPSCEQAEDSPPLSDADKAKIRRVYERYRAEKAVLMAAKAVAVALDERSSVASNRKGYLRTINAIIAERLEDLQIAIKRLEEVK